MNPTAVRILFAAGAYLLGAFPTGFLLFRSRERKDIRTYGSGATGATNVLRLKGWRLAIPVAVIDIAKGFIPAFFAARWFHDPVFSAVCAALAVAGHCYPVYIGFRGGKGVAPAAGAMFALAPLAAAGSLAVFIIVIAAVRFISLGSILAVVIFPVFLLVFHASGTFILGTLPLVLVIVLRHAGNIRRLIAGNERKFGEKAVLEP
jgi:acyl phosphate:glycerol-3-phosphate acyltransferase